MVGNIVMGTRIGGAAGRQIADVGEETDLARKVRQHVTWDRYNGVEILTVLLFISVPVLVRDTEMARTSFP